MATETCTIEMSDHVTFDYAGLILIHSVKCGHSDLCNIEMFDHLTFDRA